MVEQRKRETTQASTEHHGGLAIGRAVGVVMGTRSRNVAQRGGAKDEPKPGRKKGKTAGKKSASRKRH